MRPNKGMHNLDLWITFHCYFSSQNIKLLLNLQNVKLKMFGFIYNTSFCIFLHTTFALEFEQVHVLQSLIKNHDSTFFSHLLKDDSNSQWPLGEPQIAAGFISNYINPSVPQLKGSTGDQLHSNPGPAARLLWNHAASGGLEDIWLTGETPHKGASQTIRKSVASKAPSAFFCAVQSPGVTALKHGERLDNILFIVEYKFLGTSCLSVKGDHSKQWKL